MHIVTGMLVTALMGARKKRKRKEARAGEVVRYAFPPRVLSVRHALPGRTRFRVPALIGHDKASRKLAETLGKIDAVRTVSVDAVTGSVLIEYAADRVAPDVLAGVLIRLLGLEKELTRDVDPRAAREFRAMARSVNRSVYEATGGLVDFKTALLLVLAGLGTVKMARQRALALPAGFTLLWWAGMGLLRDGSDAT